MERAAAGGARARLRSRARRRRSESTRSSARCTKIRTTRSRTARTRSRSRSGTGSWGTCSASAPRSLPAAELCALRRATNLWFEEEPHLPRVSPVMRRRSLFLLRSVALVALLCAGCGGGVPILMYHSVGPGTDPLGVSEAELDSHLGYLVSAGYNTVTLHDVIEDQQGRGRLPANPIVLTFDDGTLDAYSTALPLLTKRGQRATFFIVAGFVAPDAQHRRVEASK